MEPIHNGVTAHGENQNVVYDNVKIPFWSLFTTRDARRIAKRGVVYDNVKIPFWSLFTTSKVLKRETARLFMIM